MASTLHSQDLVSPYFCTYLRPDLVLWPETGKKKNSQEAEEISAEPLIRNSGARSS